MASGESQSLLRSDRLSRDFVAVGAEDTVAQALERLAARMEALADSLENKGASH